MNKLVIPILTLLMSMGAWADGPDLKSILEHLEVKELTDSSAQKKEEIFVLEKCSAISFAVMDDTEEFDLGDAFFMEALDVEDEEKLTEEKILLLYERVKNYTSEYFDLLEGSEPSKGWKWFGQLEDSLQGLISAMTAELPHPFIDDLAVCLNVTVKHDLENRYEDESWTELKPKRILR